MISFIVYGKPQSRGSKIAVMSKSGRGFVRDSNKHSKPWMQAVTAQAGEAMRGGSVLTGPVELVVTFYFNRPKSHYGTGGNANKLKSNAPIHVPKKPDLSKLIRGLEDGMTGVVYRDDSQIVRYRSIEKVYTEGQERTEVAVQPVAMTAWQIRRSGKRDESLGMGHEWENV